jgi:hypothetical protein
VVGAGFEFEFRFAARERAGILGQARQGIEHFAAAPASHLTCGGAQHVGGQFEDGLAFQALGEHGSKPRGRLA